MPYQVADRRRKRIPSGAFIAVAVGLVLSGCATSSQSGGRGHIAEGEYAFWPPAPNEPRIQFLQTYRFSSDIEPEQTMFDKIVFGDDVQIVPIGKPYGVAAWRGRIYVCDITNPAVVILDLEERQTRLMTARGVEQMVQPTDIAIADDGTKYVIDRRLGKIFVFDADDRHVTTFSEEGLAPAGLDVHGEELYVADFQTQSVLVLNRRDGALLRSIGGPGGAEGEFIRPLGVQVDDEGAVYVSDAIVGRVQKFDADGTLVNTLGQLSDTPGNFVRPKHLSVDGDGVLYVVDAAFQNVQMFSRDGELLMFFGGAGDFPGAMSLPAGIDIHEDDLDLYESLVHPAFEAEHLLVVTNQFGAAKVSVYAVGKLREGHTVEELDPTRAPLDPPTAETAESATPVSPGAGSD